jgi:flagellar capping protein FliD
MTMSLSTGLISGMDTGSLVSQLVAAEAAPQTALKTRLKTTELAASAYRTVNTTFLAITAAAEAALKPDAWTPTKATSTAPTSVAVSATASAPAGSQTFAVKQLATAHAVVNRNTGTWKTADTAYGATSIQVLDKSGASKGPAIAIGGTQTLADAAAAINASTYGLSASVVQISADEFALQVTSKTSGADSTFSLSGNGTVGVTTVGQDALLKIGTGPAAYDVSSATNTFSTVMPGVTLTVNAADALKTVTVSVAPDPDAVAAKMSTLVDAMNAALKEVGAYTSNAPGSRAALKGDYAVTSLAGRLLDAISGAVKAVTTDGKDRSPASVGLEITRDGKVKFNKETFLKALEADPGLAQRMVAGAPAAGGKPAVTGIAARVLDVSKVASDATKGSLVGLAKGQESLVKGYQDQIAAWDLRLAKRKETLTRQFTAMETALSSLRNQSTWLAGQINGLPSGS